MYLPLFSSKLDSLLLFSLLSPSSKRDISWTLCLLPTYYPLYACLLSSITMDRLALRHDDMRRNKNHWLGTLSTHKGYYEIAELIMGYLSASNLAAIHAALKIKPSESVRRHYLHPLRDVDPTLQIFQSWFRDDCQILMIGPDTLLLKERIRNPEAYYRHYHPQKPPQLEAWVVGIPPTSNRII
jgi:hypothetical protein